MITRLLVFSIFGIARVYIRTEGTLYCFAVKDQPVRAL